jgi:hypothetical protein
VKAKENAISGILMVQSSAESRISLTRGSR